MHVGVFPVERDKSKDWSGLPHARGGVSLKTKLLPLLLSSSPCTWGCFERWRMSEITDEVFPMHVGVFLTHHSTNESSSKSSPCTWGCFHEGCQLKSYLDVFPMHVGVFPG